MKEKSSNKYSINYNLEFHNTKENALKVYELSNRAWNISLFIILVSAFAINGEKLSYPKFLNSIFCLVLILINSILISKKYFLMFLVSKMQIYNERNNNKVMLYTMITLLCFVAFFTISTIIINVAHVKFNFAIVSIFILIFAFGTIKQLKIIKNFLIEQIEKLNKKDKLKKNDNSIFLINTLPAFICIIICFIIVSSNNIKNFDCIMLYILNLLVLICTKPQKGFFLQYCPKCFNLRSISLFASPYCPNCQREEYNKIVEEMKKDEIANKENQNDMKDNKEN